MGLSRKEYQLAYRQLNPDMQLWCSAKYRAKKFCIEFNIERSDIIIPDKCPILGIPLILGVGKQTNNSPTLDRIDPTKGYVKDNVRVISHRANHKKQDNTIEDCEILIRYMKGEI